MRILELNDRILVASPGTQSGPIVNAGQSPFMIASFPNDLNSLIAGNQTERSIGEIKATIPECFCQVLNNINSETASIETNAKSANPIYAQSYRGVGPNGGVQAALSSTKSGFNYSGQYIVFWCTYNIPYYVSVDQDFANPPFIDFAKEDNYLGQNGNYLPGFSFNKGNYADYVSQPTVPAFSVCHYAVYNPNTGEQYINRVTCDTLIMLSDEEGGSQLSNAPIAFVSDGFIMLQHGMTELYNSTTSYGNYPYNSATPYPQYQYNNVSWACVPAIFASFELFSGATTIKSQVAWDPASQSLSIVGGDTPALADSIPVFWYNNTIALNWCDDRIFRNTVYQPFAEGRVNPTDFGFYTPELNGTFEFWPPNIFLSLPNILNYPSFDVGQDMIAFEWIKISGYQYGGSENGFTGQTNNQWIADQALRGSVNLSYQEINTSFISQFTGAPFFVCDPPYKNVACVYSRQNNQSAVQPGPFAIIGIAKDQTLVLMNGNTQWNQNETAGYIPKQVPSCIYYKEPTNGQQGFFATFGSTYYADGNGLYQAVPNTIFQVPGLQIQGFQDTRNMTIAGHLQYDGPVSEFYQMTKKG